MGIANAIKNLLGVTEEKTLLKELKRSYEKGVNNQRSLRKRWKKTEQYVSGYQVADENGSLHDAAWAMAKSDTGDVDDESIVINDVLRVHLSNMQRLSSYNLKPEVVPNDKRSPEDKIAARIGKVALADLIRRHDAANLKKRIARIIDIYGCVFAKAVFNPNKGRLIPIPGISEPNSGIEPKETYIREGEVEWVILSPRNMILPAWCSELSKADWVEEVHIVTVDWIYRNYGVVVKPENVKISDLEITGGDYQMDIKNDNDEEHQVTQDDNLVLLHERTILPCPQYPKGAAFVWCEEKMLMSKEIDEQYPGGMQYESAEMIFDDRTAYGDTPLYHLVALQDAMNNAVSSMMRYIKMFSILQGFYKQEDSAAVEKASNATAQWIPYNGANPPQYANPPEMKTTFFSFVNLIRDFIMSHGYAQDISRRKGTLSGNAIAALQEIDDTILRPTLESVETMYTKLSCKSLRLMAEHYNNNRIAKMTSRQGWEIKTFRGEMLKGNFDAEIKLMTGLPSNKMYRLEYLTKLAAEKIIDPQEVREHLEFGSDDELMEEMQKDYEIAENYVQKVTDYPGSYFQGSDGVERCVVQDHLWDNHELIIKKVKMAMREGFDEWEPAVKAESEKRLKWHQEALALKATPTVGGPNPKALTGDAPVANMPVAPLAGIPGEVPPGASIPEAQGEAMMTSAQNPSQQPDRSTIPAPGFTGGQNI